MKIGKQLLFLAFMMFLCISVAIADEKGGQASIPGPERSFSGQVSPNRGEWRL